MPRGESGRIVVEIEPEMKRRLYAALALSGSTLKDWFIKNAASFCEESVHPSLFKKLDRVLESNIATEAGERASDHNVSNKT